MSSKILKKIDAIQFGILSPDEIRKMSVTQIITADTYDEDGLPISSGLMDPRLGTLEPGKRCKTCGNTVGECIGHFGHIELARPVIHASFAKNIYALLKATCRSCGRLLLPDTEIERYKKRMKKYYEKWGKFNESLAKQVLKTAMKSKTCPHCGAPHYKIRFEKPTTFIEEGEEGSLRLTPYDVRERLEKITDDDCFVMGIDPKNARPEWMVLTVLPVPPIAVRPSITLETGLRSEDDLTHKLVDIIRINQRLRENIDAGAPQLIVEDLWELLQYHVTTYFDNEVAGIPPARHRSGRALRTLAQRLKGKEGRFRSNLSGKRVDFSARTVISPDPQLSINEVGVPEDVAKILTIPEKVTIWNIEEMKELILRGPDEHPGANYIIRPDGRRIDLRFVKDRKKIAESIEPGYIIERHLRDGDIALFNRQPSLHRMSIMAHEVRVLPYKTFRLNLSVCVAGDTKVLLDGVQKEIADLGEDWNNIRASTADGSTRTLTNLTNYWKLRAKDYGKICYRIVTESGRAIIATEDHPFFTPDGVKPARELDIGDRVIVYPMDFPIVEKRDDVILTEEDIVRIAGNSRVKKVLRELKEKHLIPLKLSDPRITAIARLLGHLFGNGTLIVGKNSKAVFRAKIEDLNDIADDLKLLGYEPSRIKVHESFNTVTKANGRKSRMEGERYYLEVRKKSFCLLLKALGCPDGDKVRQSYGVPRWVKRAPLYIKKEFLASYFGSELTEPTIMEKCGELFKEFKFEISKVENVDGMEFIEDVREMLSEFDIKTIIRIDEGNVRKDGTKTYSTVVVIRSQKEFLGKIGYAYNREAEELARLAYGYLMLKDAYVRHEDESFNKVTNTGREEVIQIASAIGESFLYAWGNRKPSYVKGQNEFPDFNEWVREY
ncbi:MAG: hypothetical protein ACTSWV_01385, partial [Candidatus Asgardarchaeia archaeon]